MNIPRIHAALSSIKASPGTFPELSELVLEFSDSGEITEYLNRCMTKDGFFASGLRVAGVERIIDENHPDCSPGGQIRPYGYLVIGNDIGGNAVAFSRSGGVYWANHISYTDPDEIKFKDRQTGKWTYVPWSVDNVRNAMTLLSDSVEDFLVQLIAGDFKSQLDALDS